MRLGGSQDEGDGEMGESGREREGGERKEGEGGEVSEEEEEEEVNPESLYQAQTLNPAPKTLDPQP